MAKKESPYQFPVVSISDTHTLLERGGVAFASQLQIRFPQNITLTAYENKGLNLNEISSQDQFYALTEITQAEIYYQQNYAPKNAIHVKFLWSEMAYLFFPELVNLREEIEEAAGSEEERLEEEFEKEATRLFEYWGLIGLGLDIYQAKPMLSTSFGVLLINEYQFEEDIDGWEFEEEIWIQPTEIFLRGLKPYSPPPKIENKDTSEVFSPRLRLLD